MLSPARRFEPRIGVDFHVFDGKYQGSRSHLIGLYRELIALRPHLRFVLFLDSVEELGRLPGFSAPNVERVRMPLAGPVKRLLVQLPALSRAHRIDLLHTQYVVPWRVRCARACTVHDVLFEPHPEFFHRTFVWRSRWLIRGSARRADVLLTVSDYSREQIADRYRLPADSITVTSNAIDHASFHPGSDGEAQVRARGLEPGGYLLTVGRIEPRKNHAGLLRAYRQLTGNVPALVIVGQRDFGYGEFESELVRTPADRKVVLISDASDRELPALYRHAKVFAYPSLAEGFGMPPLEAMASGVPVITSRCTALPEVVGEAALLVEPADVDGLRSALQSMLDDPDRARELALRGVARASEFTWRRPAEALAGRLDRHFGARERGLG